MKTKKLNKFSNYYLWYLTQHNNSKTRILHFIGLIFTILFIVQCFINKLYFFLPLAWYVVYPFSNIAHRFIEKNKPAAIDDPVYAKMADWMMFFRFLTFKLNDDLAVANRLHDPIFLKEEDKSLLKGDIND